MQNEIIPHLEKLSFSAEFDEREVEPMMSGDAGRDVSVGLGICADGMAKRASVAPAGTGLRGAAATPAGRRNAGRAMSSSLAWAPSWQSYVCGISL